MPTNISLYRGGPAYLVWNALTLKMREDWKIQNPDQFFDIPSATGIGASKGVADKMGKINFTPKIFLASLAAQLAAFVPTAYSSNLNCGQLLRPTSDLPAVIHARNGGTSNLGIAATAYAAMLSKLPVMTFAPDKPLLGSIDLTYLQTLGSAVGDAASLFATADGTYTEPAWTISDELFDRYTLKIGRTATLTAAALINGSTAATCASTALLIIGQGITGTGIPANITVAAIVSPTAFTLSAAATASNAGLTLTPAQITIVTDKDGITFTPEATLEWIKPSQEPTRDARLAKVAGHIEFRPHNMDIDEFYSTYFPEAAQVLGGSYEQYAGTQVNVTGTKTGSATLLIPLATRSKSGHDFSTKSPRTDKITLSAVDYNSAGTWQPLFTLGTV